MINTTSAGGTSTEFLRRRRRRHQQIQAMLQNQPVFIEYKKLNIFYLQTNNYADANRQE